MWLLALALVIAGVAWLIMAPIKPGKLDSFASCIKNSGATFYGAFWCSHCQKQKAMFGRSSKLLPYVECSASDGKSQLLICTEAGISGYPTWQFPDGTRETGEISLTRLAEKTACELSQ